MPSINYIQTNWTSGEISPRLYGRVDLERYQSGAERIENFIVQRFGGVKKRGGTEYIAGVKTNSKKVRLIPFVYSITQAYIVEFGDQYIRFYANGGQVESGGSPVEVASPYLEAELNDISFTQSADVLYLAHGNHAPRQLTRTSATSFSLDTTEFTDGPYLPVNLTGTSLTPADTGHATPDMTSNTAPSGTVTSTSGSVDAYKVFNRVKTSGAPTLSATSNGHVTYDYGASNDVAIDAYWVTAPANQAQFSDMVTQWRVQGSDDGTNFITLDGRESETGWNASETRFYSFSNSRQFRYYRFDFSGGGGADNTDSRIVEIGYHLHVDDQTAFNLTASAVTGINDGQGFQSSDVGRLIRILGADGVWRWAKIEAHTSTTVVTVKLYDQALPDTSSTVNWRLGAWSDVTGWPKAVGFYEGRLCYASTDAQPDTIWMSRVQDFTNHAISSPLLPDDAINISILSGEVNNIQWIAEGPDLFVGATSSVRVVSQSTTSEPFSSTNVRQRRETTFGAGSVQPILIGNVGIYADFYGDAIREFTYSFESNGYVSQDLSLLSEHLLSSGVSQMAYAQMPDSIIWYIDTNDNLYGMTYEREQNVIAFHRHTLGGVGVSVESVASIPGVDRDEIWLAVKRTVNGGTVRYVERLSNGIGETDTIELALYLDSHLTYTGASATTLTGLTHLEGESVYVWGDAIVSGSRLQGPFTVASGQITGLTAVTQATVGLDYQGTIRTLSPEIGARGGTAQTQLGTNPEVWLRVDRTVGGKVGEANGDLEDIDYTISQEYDLEFGDGTSFYSGDVRVPIDSGWDRYKRVQVQSGIGNPFHVISAIFRHRVSG